MALVQIARFLDVREAQIARSALMASGMDALLMDEYRAQILWTEQLAIGGVRLFVPSPDVDAALSFLDQVRGDGLNPNLAASPASKMTARSILSTLGFMSASFAFGWPLAAFKRSNPAFKVFAGLWIALVMLVIAMGYFAKYRLTGRH